MTITYRARGRIVYACRFCEQNFSSAGLAQSHEDTCPEGAGRWLVSCPDCRPTFTCNVSSQTEADRLLQRHHDQTGHFPVAAPAQQPGAAR